jgi:membrane-associated phospholipid phosphatase
LLNDGRAFLWIGGQLGTAPLHWQTRDWMHAGGIVAGTALSALLDDEFDNLARKNQSGTLDDLEWIGEAYGNGKNVLIGTAAFYLAGLFTRDRWIRETALLVGTASVYATLLTRIIKPVVGRARPYMEMGNHEFDSFSLSDDYNSFPSGHTVTAFAVSTVLARRIGHPLATIGLYGLATLTGLSRIYSREHWFSDVVFGAAVSIVMANSVVDWYEGQGELGNEVGFRAMVYPGGLSLVLVF